MKEFYHKHKLAILLTAGSIVLYLLYKWYESSSANNAASQDAADQAAAQDAYLQSLLYGTPSDSGLGGSSPANSGSSTTPLVNVVSNPSSPSGTNGSTSATGGTPGASPQGSASNGSAPASSNSGGVQAGVPATASQLKQIGANYAYSPAQSEAQDFASEGYTGNPAQDAATAQAAMGIGAGQNKCGPGSTELPGGAGCTSSGFVSSLFEGSPSFLAGGGAGAPPELVAACNLDQSGGVQCGSPGSKSDVASFLLGLPTQGNYELGPNGSVVQLPAGVTPIGQTPEEMAESGPLYTSANGVVWQNGVPLTGAALPYNVGNTTELPSTVGPATTTPGNSALQMVLSQEQSPGAPPTPTATPSASALQMVLSQEQGPNAPPAPATPSNSALQMVLSQEQRPILNTSIMRINRNIRTQPIQPHTVLA
jgi:hypothetical protein